MEETKVVERARGGDARAYGALVERHQARVYATLRKITGDSDLAMDLTQDAFIRAWEQLDSASDCRHATGFVPRLQARHSLLVFWPNPWSTHPRSVLFFEAPG